MRLLPMVCALALCGAAAGAAAQEDDVQKVPVQGIKNPEMKSYRAVWKGLDRFESEHKLAPAVPELRFRVLANSGKGYCVGMCIGSTAALPGDGADLAVRIAGDDVSVTVPVTADGYFSVPRSEALYDAKADLVLNQRKEKYRITVDVRTPGLPATVRRLGDLRLECKVNVAIIKEEIPFWIVAMVNSILLTRDWCTGHMGKEYVNFGFPSLVPLASATLTYGDRNEKLEGGKRGFSVRLGDPSWPDDALVKLEFAPQEPVGM
jgi:hypothetical protein